MAEQEARKPEQENDKRGTNGVHEIQPPSMNIGEPNKKALHDEKEEMSPLPRRNPVVNEKEATVLEPSVNALRTQQFGRYTHNTHMMRVLLIQGLRNIKEWLLDQNLKEKCGGNNQTMLGESLKKQIVVVEFFRLRCRQTTTALYWKKCAFFVNSILLFKIGE